MSFVLEQGTLASIVGKSGSGKSTLLSLLGALDKPTSGDVVVNGVSLFGMPDGKLTEYRRRDIGRAYAAGEGPAGAGTAGPGEAGAAHQPAVRRRAAAGGHCPRARQRTQLILADEPTGNLDEQTGDHIIELLNALSRNHNTTILVVTYDRALANMTDPRFGSSRAG